MISASAPGKFVVMGEHAVVYGKPALALAIDMRFTIRMNPGKTFRVNGKPATNATMSPHMKWISEAHGNRPVSIFIDERVPTGSGLGSSAALSAAYSGAVRRLCNLPVDHESVAREAYEAEFAAQGRGSPMDTSASVNGGGIALNVPYSKEDFLWHIEKNGNSWDISRFDVPEMTFVIGNTGIKAPTGPLVEKVRKYRDESEFAYNIVEEIGQLTLDGMKCITGNDWVELGALMSYNHKLLGILGVSCPELDSLVEAAMPTSYGAKLTGSGGGGCMVALTDKPKETAAAIRAAGGTPYIVKTGVPGLEVKVREKKPANQGKKKNPRKSKRDESSE
ncbi:MAG: mevalonate kinase [Thermoplasmata archaeon]|nr:mevalonate kinase [Thermoplasmata archaeon]